MTLCMAFPAGCTLDALIDVEGFDDDDPDPSDLGRVLRFGIQGADIPFPAGRRFEEP